MSQNVISDAPPSEIDYRILRILEKEPQLTQRELAGKMNLSLGKINFCLKALTEKGLIKAQNLLNSKNKWAYLYILTPEGIEEKARLTYHFLQKKTAEYDRLKEEIKQLKKEVKR